MPLFSYFFVVGLILAGLLYCTDAVIIPNPAKFGGSQRIGLPEPYKAPIVTDFPKLDHTETDVEDISRRN